MQPIKTVDKNLTPDALSMSNNKTCTDAGADKEQRYRQQWNRCKHGTGDRWVQTKNKGISTCEAGRAGRRRQLQCEQRTKDTDRRYNMMGANRSSTNSSEAVSV